MKTRLVPKDVHGVSAVHPLARKIDPARSIDFDHHGLDSIKSPTFGRALSPRVAVINDGPHQGGEARTFATLKSLKEIEAIYQLHRNVRTTDKDNTMLAERSRIQQDY